MDAVRRAGGPSGVHDMGLSRKEKRKAERTAKKQGKSTSGFKRPRPDDDGSDDEELSEDEAAPPPRKRAAPAAAPPAKRAKLTSKPTSRSSSSRRRRDDDDDDDASDSSASMSDIEDDAPPSRAHRAMMFEEDEEDPDEALIKKLERKLGIRKGDSDDDDDVDEGDVGAAAGGGSGRGGGGDGKASKRSKAIAKLDREFAKEGFDDDFGTFLENLDASLSTKNKKKAQQAKAAQQQQQQADKKASGDAAAAAAGSGATGRSSSGSGGKASKRSRRDESDEDEEEEEEGSDVDDEDDDEEEEAPRRKQPAPARDSKRVHFVGSDDEEEGEDSGDDDDDDASGDEDEDEDEDDEEVSSDFEDHAAAASDSDVDEDGSNEEEEEEEEEDDEASGDEDSEDDGTVTRPRAAAPAAAASTAPPAATAGKYVPPHLRKKMEAEAAAAAQPAAASAATSSSGGSKSARRAADADEDDESSDADDDVSDDEDGDEEEDEEDDDDDSEDGPAPAAGRDSKPAKSKAEAKYDLLYGRTLPPSAGGGGAAAGHAKSFLDPQRILKGSSDAAKLAGLRRRIQGQVNRLADTNVEPIANEIAGMFRGHATAEANAVLAMVILDACASEVQVLKPLMRVFAALISALHITVGPAVGSFMLEVITVRLAECASLPMLPTPTLRQLRERAAADGAAAAKAATAGAAGGADAASSTAALAMLLGDGTGSRVDTLATAGAASKVRNNLLLLLCYLYVFQVAHADLVTDILKLLAARFNETDAELLLLALTHVGFLLRAEEPVALKAILAPVHAKTAAVAPVAAATAVPAATAAGRKGSAAAAAPAAPAAAAGASDVSVSRMRVITELILDLKNNRKRAEHEQLLEASASLRKWLGRLAAKSTGVEGIDRRMRVTWVDIASIPSLGRWWLVGASWAGRAAAGASSHAAAPARLATGAAAAPTAVGGAATAVGGAGAAATAVGGEDDAPIGLSASGGGNAATASSLSASSAASAAAGGGVSAEEAALTELAVRMRMNTSVRRSIFVALMGAEDAESAIERIMRLNLRGSAEREIVRVLLDCAGQESTYNPYYAAVAARLCAYHHSFKFTFQLAYWDIFKTMDDSTVRRLYNLSRLLAVLIVGFHLSLAVVKVLDMTTSDPKTLLFLKALLNTLVIESKPDKELPAIFSRLGSSADKIPLRDGLLVFMRQYITVDSLLASIAAKTKVSGAAAAAGLDVPELKARLKMARRALESVSSADEHDIFGEES